MAIRYTNTNCIQCGKQKPKSTTTRKFLSPLCRPCAAAKWWSNSPKKRPPLTCRKCGKQFPFETSGRRPRVYCSRACRLRQITKECPHCKNAFSVPRSNADRYNFCSKQCAAKALGRDTVCKRCGNVFHHPKTEHRHYCSEACRRPPMMITCETCSKCVRRTPNKITKRQSRFCSFACYRRFTGESSIETITRKLIEAAGLAVVREFNTGKRDVFDFYIPARNLLIECDGAYWHSLPSVKKRDAAKEARAKKAGYNVARFEEHVIVSSAFPEHLARALSVRLPHPQLRLYS